MTTAAILYVFAAALTATLLYVILRTFSFFKIENLHALSTNYFTAAATSFLISGIPSVSGSMISDFIFQALFMGAFFISVFYIAAKCAQQCGVAITSISAKMSMVIPITVAVFLFHDSMNVMKVIGIILALAAVYLSGSSGVNDKKEKSNWYLPLLVFIGSGSVDTAVNIVQHYYINETNQQLYISMMFGSAGIIGTVLSIINHRKKKSTLTLASVIGGIILGVVNYFSLYFLVKCLAMGIESSFVFSVINLLVVVMSAIFAFTLFREKPDVRRVTGIGLALLAIIVLYY